MMTFLLFAPASTKCLGWRKHWTSPRDRLGRFCDIYCAVMLRHSFALRVQWHSVEQLFQWKLWTKILTTLVKRRRSYKMRITVYHRHLESLPDTSSQIFHWKPCQTLFLSLWPEYDSAPNKQDEWMTITEIHWQSNSVLTYSQLTDIPPL